MLDSLASSRAGGWRSRASPLEQWECHVRGERTCRTMSDLGRGLRIGPRHVACAPARVAAYLTAFTIVRSSFLASSTAAPHAVSLPFASNLQPHSPAAWAPHSPASRSATQNPEPAGRFLGFPWAYAAMSRSPVAVPPFRHVNAPVAYANSTLSSSSHT